MDERKNRVLTGRSEGFHGCRCGNKFLGEGENDLLADAGLFHDLAGAPFLQAVDDTFHQDFGGGCPGGDAHGGGIRQPFALDFLSAINELGEGALFLGEFA